MVIDPSLFVYPATRTAFLVCPTAILLRTVAVATARQQGFFPFVRFREFVIGSMDLLRPFNVIVTEARKSRVGSNGAQ